ncbi:hypothetical protein [Mycolicibacterium fallax]|jgi:hypothetical protein|uniref:Uncharacterized protein n=1 Tax=Mycolicibacterium fallax TaxID=1793 RepID=A0A1X1RF83_MYCFA|nr:hypothetical protein [Mycolicibacterium fallax]ORV04359.1 hypothetical protein AWC04_09455 [Mycolicibacterium fallax]BBY98549.1 hypothetical protein MFAL_20160 [Mycolicibacterium fallax]HOW92933.1 hypothetical protein [Mycolicibacterium fallax]HSA39195.1 hypothetical protein [Mycobacterium sp.]
MADYQPPADELPAELAAWFALGYDEPALWLRLTPGPALRAITTRLGTLPADFLDERVALPALAADVLGADVLGSPELRALTGFATARLGAAVGLWLLASQHVVDPFDPRIAESAALPALAALGLRLAPVVAPRRWLSEPDRREEAARLFLLWCGHHPAGETPVVARSFADRLDSIGRDRELAAVAEEHRHRMEVQRRLRERRAQEAAARYTHE